LLIPERPYGVMGLLQRWLVGKLRPGIPFGLQTQRVQVLIIQPLTVLIRTSYVCAARSRRRVDKPWC